VENLESGSACETASELIERMVRVATAERDGDANHLAGSVAEYASKTLGRPMQIYMRLKYTL